MSWVRKLPWKEIAAAAAAAIVDIFASKNNLKEQLIAPTSGPVPPSAEEQIAEMRGALDKLREEHEKQTEYVGELARQLKQLAEAGQALSVRVTWALALGVAAFAAGIVAIALRLW
jgi:hypothetical protein